MAGVLSRTVAGKIYSFSLDDNHTNWTFAGNPNQPNAYKDPNSLGIHSGTPWKANAGVNLSRTIDTKTGANRVIKLQYLQYPGASGQDDRYRFITQIGSQQLSMDYSSSYNYNVWITRGWYSLTVTGSQVMVLSFDNPYGPDGTINMAVYWSNIVIMADSYIKVKNILYGQKVELYDSAGVLQRSIIQPVDKQDIVWEVASLITGSNGLFGYFKIYDSDGTTLLYTTTTTNIFGGDEWTWYPNQSQMDIVTDQTLIYRQGSGISPGSANITITLKDKQTGARLGSRAINWSTTLGTVNPTSNVTLDQVDAVGGTTSSGTFNTGIVYAFPIVASKSGTLDTIGVNFYASGGNARVAIYSNGAGKPASLLAESAAAAITAAGWKDFAIPGSVEIVAGTTYWLAIQFDANRTMYYIAASRSYYAKTYGAFDASWSASSTQDSTARFNMRMTVLTGQASTTLTAGTTAGAALVQASFTGDANYGASNALQIVDIYYAQVTPDAAKDFQVYIYGQEIPYASGSYKLSADFRPQPFSVDTPLLSVSTGPFWVVDIYRKGALEFKGRIVGVRKRGGSTPMLTIRGVDETVQLQKRVANKLYLADPATIIRDLLALYPTGIQPGTITPFSSPINLPATYETLYDAFVQISRITGWKFKRNVDLTLDFNSDFGTVRDITIEVGKNAIETQRDTDYSQFDTKVIVIGKGTLVSTAENVSASALYGLWEEVFLEKGIQEQGTLDLRASELLAQRSVGRETITVDWVDSLPTGSYAPFDTISVNDTDTGLSGAYRVKSIKRTLPNADFASLELTNAILTVADALQTVRKDVKDLGVA